MVNRFHKRGWVKFTFETKVMEWVTHVLPTAKSAVEDPNMRHNWLRAGGTWFVGVNALPNGPDGRVGAGPPLAGLAMDFIREQLGAGDLALDPAQVSVVWPGYPIQDAGESDAAFRFQRDRDAAHVDGIKRHRTTGFRHIDECHAFLLGVPLNPVPEGASPLVVWEGSHEVMRAGLADALAEIAPAGMADADITKAYQATRRKVFETCKRRVVEARPGEAYLVHRLCLHGVSPWTASSDAPDGRIIAYFRPAMQGSAADWLTGP